MPLARTSLRLLAALVLVFVSIGSSTAAPPARADEAIPGPAPPASHTTAHVALGVGAGLTIASFLFAEGADRAYERYNEETDPDRIEDAYDDAARCDRLATTTLLVGQACLIYGLWRRFLHDPRTEVSTLPAEPRAASWSFGPRCGPDGPALAIDVRF